MSFIDFLFPKACLSCGFLGSYICLNCRYQLKPIEKDRCLYCHSSSPLGLTHPSCSRKLSIDGAISIFYYNETMRKIIKNIKYHLVRQAFSELFIIVSQQIIERIRLYKELFNNCLIQPIPLHSSRLRKRGFNQAQIISDFLSKILGLSIVDFLERKKATHFLAQMATKKERYFETRGAFIIKNKPQLFNKNILLVDDIITSGATVKEAGRTLKKAGAKKIYVFTLAKG